MSERLKKEKWNFPKKIDFLNSVGIISPRILTKINRRRNLLEHEYKNPNEEEVEDALDIAILFINYTNKYLYRALRECNFVNKNKGPLSVMLDWEKCKIIFHSAERDDDGNVEYIDKEITADQKEYGMYLNFFLKLYEVL